MSSNYPPGVTDAHPHFNPDTCDECGEEATQGEDCPACGEYVPTDEDYADQAADRQYDMLKEDGLL